MTIRRLVVAGSDLKKGDYAPDLGSILVAHPSVDSPDRTFVETEDHVAMVIDSYQKFIIDRKEES